MAVTTQYNKAPANYALHDIPAEKKLDAQAVRFSLVFKTLAFLASLWAVLGLVLLFGVLPGLTQVVGSWFSFAVVLILLSILGWLARKKYTELDQTSYRLYKEILDPKITGFETKNDGDFHLVTQVIVEGLNRLGHTRSEAGPIDADMYQAELYVIGQALPDKESPAE